MLRRKRIRTLKEILRVAKGLAGHKKLALAGADQEESLKCVDEARQHGLVKPLFIGDRQRVTRLCRSLKISLRGVEIIHEPDPKQASQRAVAMCREGEADIVMKGNVNTDVILRAILDRETGLGRRGLLSYVHVFESPIEERLMFMSDAAINISPDVSRKADMVRNAVWVAQRLGLARPKVAMLAAYDQVDGEDTPATADAAAIAKMGESGQIAGADIAGPYALDVAVSAEAAARQHVEGPVAACADILICPEINSGNFLYKSLIHFTGAEMANALVGVQAPIVMASRADRSLTKLYSMALSVLLAGDEEL